MRDQPPVLLFFLLPIKVPKKPPAHLIYSPLSLDNHEGTVIKLQFISAESKDFR